MMGGGGGGSALEFQQVTEFMSRHHIQTLQMPADHQKNMNCDLIHKTVILSDVCRVLFSALRTFASGQI
jgi:hypothetical protein